MQEEWKEILGFEGVYYISNLGNIKNRKNILLTPYPNKKRRGYCYINLQTPYKRKNSLVHRLVAGHFILNPESKSQVNHKDFNVLNNRQDNLEWVTPRENSDYSTLAGHRWAHHGEDAGNSKLKLKIVNKIRKDLLAGKLTHKEIANKHNTNYSNVAHIKRGSRWGQTF